MAPLGTGMPPLSLMSRTAAILATSLVLAACATGGGGASAKVPGITSTTITIGFLYPKTGPVAPLFKNIEPAVESAFDDINARGGVNGRRMIPLFGDDGFDNPNVALASVKAMQDKVFGFNFWLVADWNALHQYLEQRHIPELYLNGTRSIGLKLHYAFPVTTYLETQAALMPGFMKSYFDAASKPIGIMYVPDPTLTPTVDSFQAAAKAAGLNVVISQQVEASPTTCVNQVTRVRDAGAQIVYFVGGIPLTCVLRDAATIGYKPKWTGYGFMAQVLNTASGCRTEGMKTLFTFETLESPQGQVYLSQTAKYFPAKAGTFDDLASNIWGMAGVWIEGMRRAGSSPTPDSFVSGMETMHNWDSGWFAPLTFGRGNRTGATTAFAGGVVNCKWVTVDPVWRDHF